MALADSAALQAVRDWCVANFSRVKSVEFDSGSVSWSGGTVGTRAAQNTVDVTQSGWKAVGVCVSYIHTSSNYQVLPFFANPAASSPNTSVYVNFYRGSTGSVSDDAPARILVTYVKE